MRVEWFHYDVVKKFHTAHFEGVVEECHLKDLKSFDADGGTFEGWLVVLNKEKYLLPEFVGGQPLRSVLPVRIGESEKFINGSNIYKRCTDIAKFMIPARETMSFRQWVDTFAPFAHTNANHFLIYKLLILGSVITRFNFRIASNPSFGKDSLPTILQNLMPLDVAIYTPKSAARLMAMLERRLLMVNEIVDVRKEDSDALEPVIRIAGDMRPSVPNSALSVSGMTKDIYNISELSLGFIYNELHDYVNEQDKRRDKSHKYFDHAYTPATRQRYLPLLLKGELDTKQFGVIHAAEIFEEGHDFLRQWVSMSKWLMDENNFWTLVKERKDWKWIHDRPIGTKGGRLDTHFATITNIMRVYASDEMEFNTLVDELYLAYSAYQRMLGHDTPGAGEKMEEDPFLIEEHIVTGRIDAKFRGEYIGYIEGGVFHHDIKQLNLDGISEGVCIQEGILRRMKEIGAKLVSFRYKDANEVFTCYCWPIDRVLEAEVKTFDGLPQLFKKVDDAKTWENCREILEEFGGKMTSVMLGVWFHFEQTKKWQTEGRTQTIENGKYTLLATGELQPTTNIEDEVLVDDLAPTVSVESIDEPPAQVAPQTSIQAPQATMTYEEQILQEEEDELLGGL